MTQSHCASVSPAVIQRKYHKPTSLSGPQAELNDVTHVRNSAQCLNTTELNIMIFIMIIVRKLHLYASLAVPLIAK